MWYCSALRWLLFLVSVFLMWWRKWESLESSRIYTDPISNFAGGSLQECGGGTVVLFSSPAVTSSFLSVFQPDLGCTLCEVSVRFQVIKPFFLAFKHLVWFVHWLLCFLNIWVQKYWRVTIHSVLTARKNMINANDKTLLWLILGWAKG